MYGYVITGYGRVGMEIQPRNYRVCKYIESCAGVSCPNSPSFCSYIYFLDIGSSSMFFCKLDSQDFKIKCPSVAGASAGERPIVRVVCKYTNKLRI